MNMPNGHAGAELLLEHFHRLGDAPDAVPRLRRFILDLAVRGKLVEQDPHEEPATELIKRIERDTKSRVASGEFREPKSAIDFPWNELPFSVPEHWKWARLIEFSEVSYGFAFDSNKFNNVRRGMPLIRIRDISKTDTEAYTEEAYDSFYIVKQDDMLIGMDGDFNARKWKGKDALLNQRVCRIRAWRHGINSDFIMMPLQMILDHLHGSTSLTTVKHLSAKQMNGVYMPLPPLPEQRRIVAKVEELMALCDRLEAAQQQREAERTRLTAAVWQAVVLAEAPAQVSFALEQLPALTNRPAQVKALRQTILDLAVRGRLTKVPISQVENETKPFNAVTDPSRPIAYGVLKPGPHDPNGIRLVKSQHIRGWRVADEIQDRITPELDAEFKRTKLQGGEVLLNLVGASIGRSAVAPQSLRGANVSRAVAVITVAKDVLADFVVILLSALLTPERIAQEATGTAQPVLNLGTLRKLDVWLPPLAEQRRIVAMVEKLMALCDALEAALAAGEALRGKVLEATVRSDDQMIGRSDHARRPEVVQKPKVRAPRYVEPEAELELAVAAEPMGRYGAAHVVAKRGPGRPRKSAAAGNGQAEAVIQGYLHAHPGWHGKAAILEATGVDAAAWNAAIKALLEAGKVERQGEKKGARYRVAN